MAPLTVSRQTRIAADPARVHALIDDFREWVAWSPWEDLDPGLHREYSGPAQGVGARYAWSGNRKAGRGTMEITGSTPERIDVALTFEKPFPASNDVSFDLAPRDGATVVTWTMRRRDAGGGALGALMMKVFRVEKMLGVDFEKGLARLRAVAES